ncbi:hypothetical protein NGUA15_01788 [Salmonella enterica]|nr:hypothetical protein NGUA15_01788 [Salmonella enterica]GAR72182.1 hypothetical protein NGUA18_00037 [Salmonella enterica]
MDGGVFIIDNIAISRSEHCIEGMVVPFQREKGKTFIFYRLLVRYDGEITARLVMNYRTCVVGAGNGSTIVAAAVTGCVNQDLTAVADSCAIVDAHNGIDAVACDIALVRN